MQGVDVLLEPDIDFLIADALQDVHHVLDVEGDLKILALAA